MLAVLLLLCLFFSYVTWSEQHPNGADAGERLARSIAGTYGPDARVLIVARGIAEDVAFAGAVDRVLTEAGVTVTGVVTGEIVEARKAVQREAGAAAKGGPTLDVIACNHETASWKMFENFDTKFSALAGTVVVAPESYGWPNFLKTDNLVNIANQIAVIAILAVGMTMVIVTGGIDLSVGSLVALSAVTATRLMRDMAGAEQASTTGMVVCALAGIAVCAAMGSFSGLMITLFDIPPFIVTLGMMLVASGLAFILAAGQSIYEIPEAFVWLGRGKSFLGIPNAVALMGGLYLVAHVLMTRTAFGRYIYAVGGNAEGARLTGVPVRRVLLLVYTMCGATAGLGGIVLSSQLSTASPKYGVMYELYVIAAVVVGGTSLRGGQGRVLGTLIGAFIIAVIRNGMNLTQVETYTQKVVLGLVILGAVLLDVLKNRGWKALRGQSA
ncbi:MAG: ABC transporter permease [bacterium]|nr:ABC transporter permease [bacterium]